MISVEEAISIINGTVKDFGIELVDMEQSIGRILQEDLFADRDFPPFDRVTMDGIAIDFNQFNNKLFKIEGTAPAGTAQKTLQNIENCLEVMTGAVLPKGTDSVIRYEDLDISEGSARITVDHIRQGQNIHRKGEDRKKGEQVVEKGIEISAAEINVFATIGKSKIKVSRLPKCLIVSTGDELVKVEEEPLSHQIRRSNIHGIKALLKNYKIEADLLHLDDDLEAVKSQLAKVINKYEVILLSGGVSKGKFDYLPEALDQLGVKKLFHRIKQRPGKPFWFGTAPSGATIFALPGNPVSSFMCTRIYVCEWLEQCLEINKSNVAYAQLATPISFKPDLIYFAQIALDFDEKGMLVAHPIQGNGSGDFASLIKADAFMKLPRGKDLFEKGEVYPVYLFRR